jgi:hypothetical protein
MMLKVLGMKTFKSLVNEKSAYVNINLAFTNIKVLSWNYLKPNDYYYVKLSGRKE